MKKYVYYILTLLFLLLSLTIIMYKSIDRFHKKNKLPGALFMPGGFYHHRFAEFDLKDLIKTEKLNQIFPKQELGFQLAVELMQWVQQRIKSRPIEECKIRERVDSPIWKNILAHYDNGGFVHCSDHKSLLAQVLLAYGYNVRFLHMSGGIESDPKYGLQNSGHNVVEFYNFDTNSWVVLDSNFGIYYEIDKKAISALEVHKYVTSVINLWFMKYGKLDSTGYYNFTKNEILEKLNFKKQLNIYQYINGQKTVSNDMLYLNLYWSIHISMGNDVLHFTTSDFVKLGWIDEYSTKEYHRANFIDNLPRIYFTKNEMEFNFHWNNRPRYSLLYLAYIHLNNMYSALYTFYVDEIKSNL